MPHFSSASPQSLALQPGTVLRSSAEVGWHSLYVQERSCPTLAGSFTSSVTADQTLVVFLEGSAVLESWRHRSWRRALRGPGSSGLTAPGEVDELRWGAAQAETIRAAYIFLPGQFLQQAAEEFRRIGQPRSARNLSLLRLEDPTLHGIALGLLRGIRMGAPDLYAESAALLLATHLLQRGWPSPLEGTALPASTLQDQRLGRAIDHMKAHLGGTVSLLDLAREAGVSPFHFARLFKARTGVTPARYLTGLRMQQAQELLSGTDLPVEEIARLCGYLRHSAFSVAVRRCYGASPLALRGRRPSRRG